MADDNFKISLAAARVNAGLTQEEVAKTLKISKQTICNWETGKTSPTISRFQQLCEMYAIPQNYIFLPQELT